MRKAIIGIIIIINFILQSTLFQYIKIFEATPNTLIIIIVSYAIIRGDTEGAVVGFISGLLMDLFFGQYFGLYILLCTLIGYLSGKPFRNYFKQNFIPPLLLTFAAVLVYGIINYMIGFLIQGMTDFLYFFNAFILPELIYTVVICLLIYKLLLFTNVKLETYEKKRESMFKGGV